MSREYTMRSYIDDLVVENNYGSEINLDDFIDIQCKINELIEDGYHNDYILIKVNDKGNHNEPRV